MFFYKRAFVTHFCTLKKIVSVVFICFIFCSSLRYDEMANKKLYVNKEEIRRSIFLFNFLYHYQGHLSWPGTLWEAVQKAPEPERPHVSMDPLYYALLVLDAVDDGKNQGFAAYTFHTVEDYDTAHTFWQDQIDQWKYAEDGPTVYGGSDLLEIYEMAMNSWPDILKPIE